MIRVLCFGGGVNSTAILALQKLGEIPPVDRIIFCDTGVEHPNTYEYLDYLFKIFKIETLHHPEGTMLEYCQKYKLLPSIKYRWCTTLFKIQLTARHLRGTPHIKVIGIDYGERKRAKDNTVEYPLITRKMDRQNCIEVIAKAGLKIPPKSSCWLCPAQTITELRLLKYQYPEKFKMLIDLEKEAQARNAKIYFKRKWHLEEYV